MLAGAEVPVGFVGDEFLPGTDAAALELTNDNFDEVVLNSGKAAFVKFLAPW